MTGPRDATVRGGLGGSLVIAVLTYHRPHELRSTLPLLIEQARSAPVRAEVLVIDNDSGRSAEEVVRDFPAGEVRYVCEPRPGIAAARNRALDEAKDAQLLTFIDDDETPSERWLLSLLELYRSTRAAAVIGPVISEFEHEPDQWIVAGGFFRRRRLPSGTDVTVAATNNLLLDLDQIRSFHLAFDERFGLTGGEDTLFTRRIVGHGGRMVWCDEAVVVDHVPRDRLTRQWVLRRAFSSGNSWSLVSVVMAEGAWEQVRTRVLLLVAGFARLVGGSARCGVGLILRSVSHRATGLRTIERGAGMVAGVIGYGYREYRRA